MKKKLFGGTILTLAIAVLCIAGVSARTSVYTNTSYSINSNQTRDLGRPLGNFNGVEAEVTPFSAQSGTKRTTMKAIRGSMLSGTVVYNDTKSYSTTTCTYFSMGNLGSGMTYVNSASGFAGWSGWLKITAN